MAKKKISDVKKILCYVDLSKSSRDLIGYAKQLADFAEAEIYFLHSVTDISKFAGFYVPHMSTKNLASEMVKGARDKLYALCMQSIGEVPATHRIVTEGDPVDVIHNEIEKLKADLLVIGHEYKTFSFLKEDYVVRFLKNPTCPVLVFPLSGE
jgi:nucleotide-binding universal stress UspA family protein